ncbi:MAG: HIG1 domain-containing protein [Alphaproteobacteria bacterium]
MPIGYTVLFALMLATVGVLLAGVILMGAGGAANKKYGNKLMMARVSLQGLALLVLALLFFMGNK